MLMLVNQYGLSHVSAEPEFQFIGSRSDFYFPYLDLHLYFPYLDINYMSSLREEFEIEFYYRGALDRNFKFKNLFEYLLSLFSENDRKGIIF